MERVSIIRCVGSAAWTPGRPTSERVRARSFPRSVPAPGPAAGWHPGALPGSRPGHLRAAGAQMNPETAGDAAVDGSAIHEQIERLDYLLACLLGLDRVAREQKTFRKVTQDLRGEGVGHLSCDRILRRDMALVAASVHVALMPCIPPRNPAAGPAVRPA